MTVYISIAAVILAGLVHASFQLSTSLLLLLSSHALGSKKSQKKVLKLSSNFAGGVLMIGWLLLISIIFLASNVFGIYNPKFIWIGLCIFLLIGAVLVWLFYYRRQNGTVLWLPRSIAGFLSKRAENTHSNIEAFLLGIFSVIYELPFIILPLLTAAVIVVQLPLPSQIIGTVIYACVSILPIMAIWTAINSGHSLASLQRWRERNKHFLQFTSGAGLVVLSFIIYVNQLLPYTGGLW